MRGPQPTPGHPIARDGKPYIWVTWLSALLGGKQCLWSAWFKAHYKYAKFETEGADLAEWSRDHNRMMRDLRIELEEAGWTVTTENQNDFQLEGEAAIETMSSIDALVLMLDLIYGGCCAEEMFYRASTGHTGGAG